MEDEHSEPKNFKETPEEEVDRKIRAAAQWLVNEFTKASPMERFRIVLDVILAVVAIGALFIYGGQLDQMRRANDLTKEAIHSSERAWVGVKNVTPDSFERGADVDSDARLLLGATFTLRNYGHSAAQHVRIFPRLETANSSNTTSGICDDSKAGVYVGDVILPDQERDYAQGVRITVIDMESALKQQNPAMGRNLILSLRGCVEYIDDPTEKTLHHTPFSYFVTRKGNQKFFTPDLQSVPGSDIGLSLAPLNPGTTN